jgi:hypothetical protein
MSKAAMVRHEATCFLNPARRACKTCAHEYPPVSDEPDYSTGYPGGHEGRGCEKDMLYLDEKKEQDIRFDCPKWRPKGKE